jgi:tRNA(His) guanylyltransferase
VFFKRGTYLQRRTVKRKFTLLEIEKLPPKHEARKNPELLVERSEVGIIEMPIFRKVTNRVGVIFNGEAPVVEQTERKEYEA